jgi:hypothetical protein
VSAPRPQAVAAPAPTPLPVIGLRAALPWLLFAGLVLLVGLYFVSTEQSATSLLAGTGVHEWLHDGRHLLGFPCH